MENTVSNLIKEISGTLTQVSSSSRDETRIMQAMLSDSNYEVKIFNKDGTSEPYCPAKEFRSMCASIISNAAKVPAAEAAQLTENYNLRKSEAAAMVNLSKEFVNTYLQTGRKLPLGARETSDVSLSIKHVAPSTRLYPQKVGVNDDGSDCYSKTPTHVPGHDSIRVHAPCPSWVR